MELELEFDLANLLASDPTPTPTLCCGRWDPRRRQGYRPWQGTIPNYSSTSYGSCQSSAWRRSWWRPHEKPLSRQGPFTRLKDIHPKKKTTLVWDGVSGPWRQRWGYKRTWDDTKEPDPGSRWHQPLRRPVRKEDSGQKGTRGPEQAETAA